MPPRMIPGQRQYRDANDDRPVEGERLPLAAVLRLLGHDPLEAKGMTVGEVARVLVGGLVLPTPPDVNDGAARLHDGECAARGPVA